MNTFNSWNDFQSSKTLLIDDASDEGISSLQCSTESDDSSSSSSSGVKMQNFYAPARKFPTPRRNEVHWQKLHSVQIPVDKFGSPIMPRQKKSSSASSLPKAKTAVKKFLQYAGQLVNFCNFSNLYDRKSCVACSSEPKLVHYHMSLDGEICVDPSDLLPELRTPSCSHCGSTGPLYLCCKKTFYCGLECQIKARWQHREHCKSKQPMVAPKPVEEYVW